MPPPLPVFAQRNKGRVVFADALPLSLRLDGLRTRDGFDAVAHATATVRAVDKPADVQLFAEAFLAGRDAVSADDVRRHVGAALGPAAADYLVTQNAADLPAGRPAFEAVLAARLDAIAFGCGLERLGPLTVNVDCPAYLQQQQRDAARHRQRQDAEHAARLAASLAAVGPAYRLPAGEQAALLPTLLAAMPAGPCLLAAGPNLVRLTADGETEILAMPPEVGPLRCVRKLGDDVAVGGVTGVAVLDARFAPRAVYTSAGSGRGFNSVARRGDAVAAVHGEIGLTIWYGGDAHVFATPGPARHLIVAADRLFFAAGGTLCTFDDGVRPLDEGDVPVVGLLAFDDRVVVVVRRDGTLTSWDAATCRPAGEARTNADVVAVTKLDAGGLRAVVLADDRGRVDAFALDGQPLGRLATQTGAARMLAVAGGRVIAVTADRSAVTVFAPAAGDPPRTINVLARTGNHITDLVEG